MKNKLPFVEIGDSDNSEVGDWVIAVGNPFWSRWYSYSWNYLC